MPDPKFLSDDQRKIIGDAAPITAEDLKDLRELDVEEYFEASDVLGIKDVRAIADLKDFHFGWLNLDHRRRVGMGHWRWVQGELAALVRRHNIVQEAVGGGAAVDIIANGDMILGFMPMKIHNRRVEFLANKNREQLGMIKSQNMGQGALDEHQKPVPEVTIKRTYEGHPIGD